jgi:hypothetical protein
VHLLRNVLASVPKGNSEMVAAAIRTVFAQPDAEHVHAQLDVVATMLGRQFPQVEAMLRGVIILSMAAVAGGLEVQERRDAAVEARRLAGLLQLSAYGPYGLGAEADPPPSLSAVLDIKLLLRNDGPRDVTVTHANAGGFVLLEPVPLPAQTTRALVMHQNLRCSTDPPRPSLTTPEGQPNWPGPLQITAETPGGSETIVLARPPYTDHAAEVCAWMRNGRPARPGGAATTDPV